MSTPSQFTELVFTPNGLHGCALRIGDEVVYARIKCCACGNLADQAVNTGPLIADTLWCRDLDAFFGLAGLDNGIPICKGLGK